MIKSKKISKGNENEQSDKFQSLKNFELSQAVERKLKNNAQLNFMDNAAKKLAEEKFAIEVQFPKFENVLKTALN